MATDLLIDGTEQRIQRPQDAVAQVDNYSGEKKAHTKKNLLLVDQENLTYVPGTKDTGFQGYEPSGVTTSQPQKTERQAIE